MDFPSGGTEVRPFVIYGDLALDEIRATLIARQLPFTEDAKGGFLRRLFVEETVFTVRGRPTALDILSADIAAILERHAQDRVW